MQFLEHSDNQNSSARNKLRNLSFTWFSMRQKASIMTFIDELKRVFTDKN